MSQAVKISPVDALDLVAAEAARAAKPCVTASFQAECVVLVHMLIQVRPDIPVLFLDTVHHFPLTLTYRDELTARWGLNLVTLRAAAPRPGLWKQDLEGLLWRTQGGAPVRGARAPRHVVHGPSSRPVAHARGARAGRALHAADGNGPEEGQSARVLVHERGLGLRQAARDPAPPAVRPGLHEHRLRALHDASGRSIQRALGTMAGTEAGMRDPPAGETLIRGKRRFQEEGVTASGLNRCRTAAARRLAVSLVIHTEHLRLGGIVTACGWLPAVSRHCSRAGRRPALA